MMPSFRLEAVAPAGNRVTYWTQDPDGMARRLREAGWFVSYNVEREDGPLVVANLSATVRNHANSRIVGWAHTNARTVGE